MLYDSYKKKILKWASIRDFVLKHKIVFSLILVAIIALMSVLLAMKGTITSHITVNAETVYGEKLNCQSGAFLAFTGYEYREVGSSEWSEDRPRKPGKYEVRGFAKKTFGGKNYTEVVTFTINKKDITVSVKEDNLPYGDSPSFSANLSYDDYIDTSVLNANYSPIYDYKQTITPILQSVVIKNSDGLSVNDCYNISVSDKTVNILKRDLSLKVDGATKVYDGTALACSNYSVTGGKLVDGDNMQISFPQSIVFAGEVKNTPDISITNTQGKDVTEFYNLNIDQGTLSVTKRKLVIKTPNAEKVYDGKPLYSSTYEITDGTLANGDRFQEIGYPSLLDAGEVKNEVNHVILNAYGEDVTQSYDVVQDAGVLTVRKKSAVINTLSFDGVYNGLAQYYENYTADGIVEGERTEVASHSSITNVGTAQNIISIEVYRYDGSTSTSSYDFTYNYGTLTISPLHISVKAEDITSIYDGTPLISSKPEIISGELALPTHTLFIKTNGSQTTVGSSTNYVVEASIFENSEDITANYNIKTSNGLLTVIKREITVKPKDIVKEYDATESTVSEIEVVSQNKIANGQEARFVLSGSLTDIGTTQTTINSFNIFDQNGNVVSEYYDITLLNGQITIYPRTLKLKPVNKEVIYDGTEHTADDYVIVNGSLLQGHTIDVVYQGSQTVVGTNNNITFSSAKVFDGQKDVSSLYNITFEYGRIIVKKRAISVSTGSATFVYNGQMQYYDSEDIYTTEDLAVGDSLYVESRAMPIVYGVYDNAVKLVITAENGDDRTDCYAINNSFGKITIERRQITLSLYGGSKVYDGTPLFNESFDIISEYGFAETDYYEIVKRAEITDVGVIRNNLEFEIYSDNGISRTDSYIISFENAGWLEVTSRLIVVKFKSTTKVYDGKPFGLEGTLIDYEVSGDGLALPTHLVTVTADSSTPWCGSLSVEISNPQIYNVVNQDVSAQGDYTKYFIEENNVTKNYVISYRGVTAYSRTVDLTITKRPIVLRPKTLTKEYDATALVAGEGEISPNSKYDVVDGQRFICYTEGSQTEVGRGVSSIIYCEILDSQGYNVNENYEVTLEKGALIVTKRNLSVETPSYQFDYDGAEHYYTDGFSIANLPSGFSYTVESYLKVADAGVYENYMTFRIYLDGIDKTNSFVFNKKSGTITINKAVIKVNTYNAEAVYDGNEYSNPDYEILNISQLENTIVYPFNVELVSSTATSLAGVWDNEIVLKLTNSNTGDDVTENFTISYESLGQIVITKRQIFISTGSAEKVFDGAPLFCLDYTQDGTLAVGDTISIASFTSLSEVGVMDNILTFKFTNALGNDVTSCYEVVNEYIGTLQVNIAEKITVKATDVEFVYNGMAQKSSDCEIIQPDLSLNLRAEIVADGSQANVGTSPNNIISCSIYMGETDVTNYFNEVELLGGTITVIPLEVNLVVYSSYEIYDGTEKACSEYYYSYGSLLYNHEFINPRFVGAITEVGTATTTFAYDGIYDISDETKTDISSNYDIIITDGEITVAPREVYIYPVAVNVAYDGNPHYATEWDYYGISQNYINYKLVEGHNIEVVYSGEQTEIGTSPSSLTVKSVDDSNGNSVELSNYSFYYYSGYITVSAINIDIECQDVTFVYDGEVHSNDSYTIVNANDLLTGHSLKLLSAKEFVDVGTYTNELYFSVVDKNGKDVSSFYSFTFYGNVIITPRTLTIQTGSAEKVYDGTELSYDNFEIVSQSGDSYGLAKNHSLQIANLPALKNAGTIANEIAFIITDNNGNQILPSNYEIVFEYGTLTVLKKDLKVSAEEMVVIYDGQYHSPTNGFSDDLVSGERIIIQSSINNINVCEINYAEFEVVSIEGGDINNYNIEYDYNCNFQIKVRPIIIKPIDLVTEYNGEYQSVKTGEACGEYALCEGHVINLAVTNGTQKEIGTYTTSVQRIRGIYDADGNVVSTNYAFSRYEFLNGTFTITAIEVTVQPIPFTLTYMGEAVVNQIQFAKIKGEPLSGDTFKYTVATDGYTVNGGVPHTLTIENFTIERASGTAYSKKTTTNSDGSKVIEYGPYKVTLLTGSLTIKPRRITVESASKEITYDSSKHTDGIIVSSDNGTDCKISSGSLANGESIVYTETVNSITAEEYLSGITEKPNTIGSVSIMGIDENGQLIDLTDNYEIVKSIGTLKVI